MALNNIDAAAESFQKASELEPTDGKEQLLWKTPLIMEQYFLVFCIAENKFDHSNSIKYRLPVLQMFTLNGCCGECRNS